MIAEKIADKLQIKARDAGHFLVVGHGIYPSVALLQSGSFKMPIFLLSRRLL